LYKKYAFFFCIIFICFLCVFITCVIFLDSPEKYKKFILDIEESIVRDYAQVEAVNILEFDGWGRAGMLRMQIFFHDNNWLLLGNVHCNKTLDLKKMENIDIEGCNGYEIINCVRAGPADYDKTVAIFSQCIGKEINVSLNSLNDVIEKYLSICVYFDNLADRPDERFLGTEDINWTWKNNFARFRIPLHESYLWDGVTF
jgi:hypothetical protein